MFQAGDELPIIQDRVGFEVQLKAANVKIGRSDGGEQVIDDENFAVQDSFLVHVDLDPGPQQVCKIRLRSPKSERSDRASLDDQPHIQTVLCGLLEGRQRPPAGGKIRSLDVHATLCGHDGQMEQVTDQFTFARRTAIGDLNELAAFRCRFGFGEIIRQLKLTTGEVVPVIRERFLQIADAGSFYFQMRVAPKADALVAGQIFIADVHAADKTERSVDHHDLAVISEVQLEEVAKGDRQEVFDLDACLQHVLKDSLRDLSAAETVDDHSHLHSLRALLHEEVPDLSTDLVVFYGVVLDMNLVLSLQQSFLEFPKLFLAVCEHLDAVV